jgi:hypothetical protein
MAQDRELDKILAHIRHKAFLNAQVELSTHVAQDRELDVVRNNIMQLLLKLEQPIYINKRNRQDRSANNLQRYLCTVEYACTVMFLESFVGGLIAQRMKLTYS